MTSPVPMLRDQRLRELQIAAAEKDIAQIEASVAWAGMLHRNDD